MRFGAARCLAVALVLASAVPAARSGALDVAAAAQGAGVVRSAAPGGTGDAGASYGGRALAGADDPQGAALALASAVPSARSGSIDVALAAQVLQVPGVVRSAAQGGTGDAGAVHGGRALAGIDDPKSAVAVAASAPRDGRSEENATSQGTADDAGAAAPTEGRAASGAGGSTGGAGDRIWWPVGTLLLLASGLGPAWVCSARKAEQLELTRARSSRRSARAASAKLAAATTASQEPPKGIASATITAASTGGHVTRGVSVAAGAAASQALAEPIPPATTGAPVAKVVATGGTGSKEGGLLLWSSQVASLAPSAPLLEASRSGQPVLQGPVAERPRRSTASLAGLAGLASGRTAASGYAPVAQPAAAMACSAAAPVILRTVRVTAPRTIRVPVPAAPALPIVMAPQGSAAVPVQAPASVRPPPGTALEAAPQAAEQTPPSPVQTPPGALPPACVAASHAMRGAAGTSPAAKSLRGSLDVAALSLGAVPGQGVEGHVGSP